MFVSLYAHTVTVLISQLFRNLTAIHQYQRGVSFVISLQHADQKNADGNSHHSTALHTLCTCLYVKSKQTSMRRNREKYNTRHNHTDTQERILTHVRTILPGGRQYAGDATTQLLCIMAVCTYPFCQMINMYTNSRQAPCRG